MSFLRTLATVAVGVAAAKGAQKYKQMGGMAGLQEMMKGMGGPGGMAGSMTDQMAEMAEKMGMPGGSKAVKDMMASFGMGAGGTMNETADAAAAGFGGLMSAMTSAAATTGERMDEMMGGMLANTPASAVAEANAKLMIRAMIQGAKADGEIDADERAAILEHLKDVPAEEMTFVKEQLAAPLDIAGLANDTAEAARAQVYATSMTAITVDTEQEKTYLKQLATALQLDPATVNSLHASMGRPPLDM